jgi:beta-lactamase regulating signal transducer with metallopeptidase domain
MLMALDVAAKGLLVLAVAAAACALLRRRSAATRHLVWSTAMISLLLLPVLASLVPSWQMPLLPASWAAPVDAVRPPFLAVPQASREGSAKATPDASPASRGVAAPTNGESSTVAGEKAAPASGELPPEASGAPREESAAHLVQGGLSVLVREALYVRASLPAWPTLLAGLLLFGTILVLAHLMAGAVRVVRMIRRARPVADESLRSAFAWALARLDIRRGVRLLESEGAAVPVAWEMFRPTVLVPAAAASWSADRQRVVLLHELAHVRRRDCQIQLLAHLALAVHWFNPLGWWAVRRLRIEREHACDDHVLRLGTRASDYADHLLQIARGLLPAAEPGWAAVAMARSSRLEARVAAILDPENPRRLPDRRATMIATVTTFALLLPLAAVQLGAQTHDATHAPGQAPAHDATHAPAPAHDAAEPHLAAPHSSLELPGHAPALSAPLHSAPGEGAPVPGALAAQGTQPSLDELVQMRIHGVSPEFIREMREALGHEVSVRDLVQMRIHGSSPELARAVRELMPGEVVEAQDVVQMSIHGISPELIAEARQALGGEVSTGDLVQMGIHGASPEYIRAMRAAFSGDQEISMANIVQLRIHGASPEYVDQLIELMPDETITVGDVVQMRIHGVSVELVRELRDDGYRDLTVADLVKIKIHGFDRFLRRRGGDR